MYKIRKLFAIISVLIILAIPALAFASSYSSYLELYTTFNGATRSYNGTDITIECYSSTTFIYPNPTYNYTVSLYRNRPWPLADDYIGSVSFPVNGYDSATWTNVGTGKYYFRFSKVCDYHWTYADPVNMYN